MDIRKIKGRCLIKDGRNICFTDFTETFDWVDHSKLWKILEEMRVPDHLTCLLKHMYAGQETTVRTRHGTMNRFKIGKGACQACILSPCLFNLYSKYIMRKAGLDESRVEIKISGKNINSLRYAGDTTLMAESEEELKSLFMKVKEWKSWLETQYSNNQEHGIQSHHLMANRRKKVEVLTDFLFLGSQITADSDCSHEIKRYLLLGRKVVTNPDGELNSSHQFADKGLYLLKLWFFQ